MHFCACRIRCRVRWRVGRRLGSFRLISAQPLIGSTIREFWISSALWVLVVMCCLYCGGRKAVPQQPCQYLNKCIYYYLTTINTCQICNYYTHCKPLIIGIALPFSITLPIIVNKSHNKWSYLLRNRISSGDFNDMTLKLAEKLDQSYFDAVTVTSSKYFVSFH